MNTIQNSWAKFGRNILIRKAGPDLLELRTDLPGYDGATQLMAVSPDDIPELVEILTKWRDKRIAHAQKAA